MPSFISFNTPTTMDIDWDQNIVWDGVNEPRVEVHTPAGWFSATVTALIGTDHTVHTFVGANTFDADDARFVLPLQHIRGANGTEILAQTIF